LLTPIARTFPSFRNFSIAANDSSGSVDMSGQWIWYRSM